MEIKALPAFKDNYIWILIDSASKKVAVVDPGEALPVVQILSDLNLALTAILITHHHYDHSNGAYELMQRTKAPVLGPNSILFPGAHLLQDAEEVRLPEMNITFTVRAIPGHTLDHIAFVSKTPIMEHPVLFCGDTLFTGGCGRVFEGTAQQMVNSLQKLKQLEPTTLVYCGHEYTKANLEFARLVEPNNTKLLERIEKVTLQRNKNAPTVPSLLKEELETNPFLRTDQKSVHEAAEAYADKKLTEEVQVFATIREWKNDLS